MARTRTRPEVMDDRDYERLIARTLSNYANITISMIGTHVRPYGKRWKVVFEEMIREGKIVCNRKVIDNRSTLSYALSPDYTVPTKLETEALEHDAASVSS